MARRLTQKTQPGESQRATKLRNKEYLQLPFKIAIDHTLEKPYRFIDMTQNHLKQFSQFLEKTVGNQLSIQQVNELYKRAEGKSKNNKADVIMIDDEETQLNHYTNGSGAFRIFGYFQGEYFCIHRIDGNHQVHR